MIPASFQAGMNWPGFPAPVVTTCTPSSRITWAMPAAQGFISIRFTPKGLSVSSRARRISLRTRSASQAPVAIMPRAPALEQAAANSPVATLAMPPWIMGNSVPRISFNFFTVCLSPHANSIRHPPQVRPPPKPTARIRLPGPIFPCSRSSLRTRGMLAAEVLPYSAMFL